MLSIQVIMRWHEMNVAKLETQERNRLQSSTLLRSLNANMLLNIRWAYHFVVDLMKVYLTDFIDNVFTLKSDEAKASVTVGLLIKH